MTVFNRTSARVNYNHCTTAMRGYKHTVRAPEPQPIAALTIEGGVARQAPSYPAPRAMIPGIAVHKIRLEAMATKPAPYPPPPFRRREHRRLLRKEAEVRSVDRRLLPRHAWPDIKGVLSRLQECNGALPLKSDHCLTVTAQRHQFIPPPHITISPARVLDSLICNLPSVLHTNAALSVLCP